MTTQHTSFWHVHSLFRKLLLIIIIAALIVTSLRAFQSQTSAATVAVGAGSYNTTLPAGAKVPDNQSGGAVAPRRTGSWSGPAPTNDWWSSLIWHRYPGNPYGENLFAYPLSAKAGANGMSVGYSTTYGVGTEYHYGHNPDLTLSVAGLNSPDVKVDGFSDLTVTAYFAGGGPSLKTTIGHGLPFAYATKTGGDAQVILSGTPTIWTGAGTNALGITLHGRHYGIFGPSGSSWSQSGTILQSNLGGKDYFSVALLPDNSTATFNDYRTYAYAFVTNTTVSWSYNAAGSRLVTNYNITTTAKEGSASGTMIGLLRHHWLNSGSVNTPYTYVSSRGQIKVVRGSSFSTDMPYNGVLPSLPLVANGSNSPGYSAAQLYAHVDAIYNNGAPVIRALASDTYWTGKDLNKLGQLVRIADQLSADGSLSQTQRDRMGAARGAFLNVMKGRLQDWLTAPDGDSVGMFYYNSTWGTLIGYPAGFGSDTELNDHHFHYGYYISAAAIIGQYDPAWVADSAWGGMIKLLIRDANSWQRNDSMFPFMRSTDPYVGHSWASGHAGFGAGNNQESSSESMEFNQALIAFGSVVGDTTIRDFGIYLYANEVQAIEQYWMDVDDAVYPTNFGYRAVGMVWGDGGAHSTWFSASPEMIHGINMLPITAGSVYLGRKPNAINTHYNEIVAENGGQENEWVDIIWSYQALANPGAAISKFGQGNSYTPEDGETKAHTYHWLYNLQALGLLDTGVTANVPTYNVFTKNGVRTYVVWNPTGSQITASFSTGVNCTVPARSLIASTNCVAGPTPTATRTNTAGPSPTRTNTTNVPTATNTSTQIPGGSGNVLYVLDGAATGVQGQLSLSAGAGANSDTMAAANGNFDGTPNNPLVYVSGPINASYDATRVTQFNAYVDAAASAGNASQVRVSYDFSGDGTWDRLETYNYFATDPVAGFETYTQGQGIKSQTGSFANLTNGRVRLEIWSAIGSGSTNLRTSATSVNGQQSLLNIPYTASTPPTATRTRTNTSVVASPTRTRTNTLVGPSPTRTRTNTVGGPTATRTRTNTTSPGTSIKVNFQLASGAAYPGYLIDGGAVYAARGNGQTYGWNVDNTTWARDRNAANSPDERYDTLNHMQKGGGSVWEIALPNGTYTVRIVAGDPSNFDSVYNIAAENITVVSGTPNTTTRWFDGTQTITVSDGRLSITNGAGSSNNKIAFIDITGGTANTPTATRTRTNTTGTGPSATPTRTNTTTSGTAAWAPGVSYAVGATVSYGGLTYRCQQAHTSQAGWEPPNAPALWLQI